MDDVISSFLAATSNMASPPQFRLMPRRKTSQLTRQHVWLWTRDLDFLKGRYSGPANRGVSFAIREIISKACEWLRNQEEGNE